MVDLRKELTALEAGLKEIVLEAGNGILLPNWGRATSPRYEETHGFACQEDIQSSDFIYRSILRKFPHVGVLDEERFKGGLDERAGKELCVIVDPLDSTSSYVGMGIDKEGKRYVNPEKKTPDWGLIVGVTYQNQPILGISYKPAKGEIAYGRQDDPDDPSSWNGYLSNPIMFSPLSVNSKSDEVDIVVSRHRGGEKLQRIIDQLSPRSITRMSGSLRPVEVAAGRANMVLVTPSSKTNLWDICGTEAIVRCAGGLMTDVYGEDFDYNGDVVNEKGILATNGHLHQKGMQFYHRNPTLEIKLHKVTDGDEQ